MITIEQISFAGDLGKMYDARFPIVHPYFAEMCAAIELQNESNLAKFSAFLIIELCQRGHRIAAEAKQWMRLFGNLPDFSLLTQPPPSV